MITVHKISGVQIVINAELIESLEGGAQQTVVNLATGNRFIVRESADEITQKVLEYRRKVAANATAPINPIRGYTREN